MYQLHGSGTNEVYEWLKKRGCFDCKGAEEAELLAGLDFAKTRAAEREMLLGELNQRPHMIPRLSESVLNLTGVIVKQSQDAEGGGGYGDVFKCDWQSPIRSWTRTVAVKVLRWNLVNGQNKGKFKSRLDNELKIWKTLSHKNILPLSGICNNFGDYPSFVCPWLGEGNLHRYLEQYHLELDMGSRYRLAIGIARGLLYLHRSNVIHGDLTPRNVLIDNDSTARISDFGLSRLMHDSEGTFDLQMTSPGAVPYAAPELLGLQEDERRVSVLSDIYSFGCVVFKVFSGAEPYSGLNPAQVVIALFHREKIARPSLSESRYLTDEVWLLVNKCWDDTPSSRSSMESNITDLVELARS